MNNKTNLFRYLPHPIGFIVILVFISLSGFAGNLRAGVSKVNITNETPTKRINDPIYAKALAIGDGFRLVVLVTLDIVRIESSMVEELRERIGRELPIDADHIFFMASHNHWVQDQLADNLNELVVKAVKEAYSKMERVHVGAGTGMEERITMNRRIQLDNGKEWTIRRATPEPWNRQVEGIVDAFDPEIGILRLDRIDGKPLAVLYNFAAHAYTGVPNRGVTASLPGFASNVIEDVVGHEAVAFFVNGAAGDITPVLYKDVNIPKMDEMLGTYLGVSTLKAWQKIPVTSEGELNVVRERIKLPARPHSDVRERIDSLEANKMRILDYFKGKGCGALGGGTKLNFEAFLPLYLKYRVSEEYPSDYAYRYMHEKQIGKSDLQTLDEENRNDLDKYLISIQKLEALIVLEANLGYLKNLHLQEQEVEITGIKIGEFVLITFPGELFCDIGLNIKKSSPHQFTFIAGYTNGSVGYAPSGDAYSGNAYEVSLTVLAPEWQQLFEEKVSEILKKL